MSIVSVENLVDSIRSDMENCMARIDMIENDDPRSREHWVRYEAELSVCIGSLNKFKGMLIVRRKRCHGILKALDEGASLDLPKVRREDERV